MKKLALVCCILSGCTTVKDVQRADNYTLCYCIATGKTAGMSPAVFWAELDRRGANCNTHMDRINLQVRGEQMEQQRQAEAQRQLMATIKAMQPPPSQTVNCTSQAFGTTVQTQCR